MALEDTALRLIRKFGQERTVALQIPAESPADPAKPWDVNPNDTLTSISAPAVVTPIARNLVDGVSVQQGDETVLIAGLSLGTTIPKSDNLLLDEGQQKIVVAVERIKPGKTDYLWKLQVRAQ